MILEDGQRKEMCHIICMKGGERDRVLSEKSCDIGLCWAEFSASALFSLVLIVHDVWDVELLGCCRSLERLMGTRC